ncbi:MAG TPA: hypothetical protein PKV94_14280 [Syntrophales bacterium]|nr:hypothetical protein [Syntrophales bacterium]
MTNNFFHKAGLKRNRKRLRAASVIAAIICLFALASLSDVKGADWVHYGRDDSGNDSFYDKDSVSNVSKGVIKVWTKRVYSDAGRESVIHDYDKSGVDTAGYESLSYSKELFFINCLNGKCRRTEGVDYSSDGHSLQEYQDGVWIAPPLDSALDTLMKEVCKKFKRPG